MILHQDKKVFEQAVRYTAEKLNILPIYIEKDYWVTYALKILFTHPTTKEYLVFKGGTSLAKCYNLIARFSEDIDLVILRTETETDNQSKRKIKAISTVVSDILPEIDIEGITHKIGKIRKTAHAYSHYFGGDFGQVRDFIVLEATWLGYYEPFACQQISSLIGKVLFENHQPNLVEQYELQPFNIRVLQATRTLCEKIMSLVRFSYDKDPIIALRNKIRHVYDIHQMLKNKELAQFFYSDDFEMMLNKVANDDVDSFKNNNRWLQYHPKEAIIFNDGEIWEQLDATYLNDFSKLIYGDLPAAKDIQQTLAQVRDRVDNVKWTLSLLQNL